MRRARIIVALVALAAGMARAENPTNLVSFVEETKIKGAFVPVGGELFFVTEKGGPFGWGYIGKFIPTSAETHVVSAFDVETKPKGLCRMGDELWFVCEKGGSNNLGYVGRYVLESGVMEHLCDFPSLTSAKSPPFMLYGQFCFFAETGGAYGQGALMSYSCETGLVTWVSFNTQTGTKPEAPPVMHDGHWFYGGREGGDLSQQGGKGAGTLGILDLENGVAIKLLDLNATQHGARIKFLCPVGSRLYYTADEGGNLALNGGKGYGAVGCFDPASNAATSLFVCADTAMGTKPKGLVAIRDRVYFNCGEGGAEGCGMWYAVCVSNNAVQCIATNDVLFGNKSDRLTQFGPRIYCATEQGGAYWLGGISCLELEAPEPELVMELEPDAFRIEWSVLANDAWLEWSDTLAGPWIPFAEPGVTHALVETFGWQGFFRLRRP